tara:strand:- start:14549 stop:16285 length:1737 start_codon:yes stop_codon:yes gene_type:complete
MASEPSSNADSPVVAYFSMEIALHPAMKTYSGGLGVLAGDMIRAAADSGVPMVAVSLIHRLGYFRQELNPEGYQIEHDANWPIEEHLEKLPQRVLLSVEGREVMLRAWKYNVSGVKGAIVPVYLLDSNLSENCEGDRGLTDKLYGGNGRYRLLQEMILGIGGVRLLRALGYNNVSRFHMNEGHAALIGLELLDESAKSRGRKTFDHEDVEHVRRQCVFTTHTPVSAGHDQFPLSVAQGALGRADIFDNHEVFCCDGVLNMTYLALNLSHYVNGVAKKHGEVSRAMLQPKRDELNYQIDWITNGVHTATWAAPPFQEIFDRYLPGWREDSYSLRNALIIPPQAVWRAHAVAKYDLIARVNSSQGSELNVDALTVGFARRAATYKRGDLIFHDLDRLRALSSPTRPIQLIFAGKAHPADNEGKEIIRRIFHARTQLAPNIEVAYLENYDMELAKLLVAGCDVWLNTPEPPLEASGTSGMKAAVNGVPSLSVLDGWWLEGCVEGVTGWAIGSLPGSPVSSGDRRLNDANSLYNKLENEIIPLFYNQWGRYVETMRHCIALNGSFFSAQRMLQQYVSKAYFI